MKIHSMYTVYVIKSQRRNYIYVGMTNDFQRRFKQHREGKSKTTRQYRPLNVILTEKFSDRKEARAREKYFKSGVGREFIRKEFINK